MPRLSSSNIDLELTQLDANGAQAQAAIAQAEASLAQARANADEAARQAARSQELADAGSVPRTQAEITQEPGIGFAEVSGESSLSEVVAGLNALGIRPRDMIDILKAIHFAGALHAELVIR